MVRKAIPRSLRLWFAWFGLSARKWRSFQYAQQRLLAWDALLTQVVLIRVVPGQIDLGRVELSWADSRLSRAKYDLIVKTGVEWGRSELS